MFGPLLKSAVYHLTAVAGAIRPEAALAEVPSVSVSIAMPHVKKWEGCRLKAYYCPAGKCTIGYGHTGVDVRPGMTISMVRAEALLLHDLRMAEKILDDSTPGGMNANQRAAVISFIFNVGRRNYLTSTLRKRLINREYARAAEEFARWVYAANPKTGKKEKLAGLISRRAEERALFMAPPS